MNTLENASEQKELMELMELNHERYEQMQAFPDKDYEFFRSIFTNNHKDQKSNRKKIEALEKMKEGKANPKEIKVAKKLLVDIEDFEAKNKIVVEMAWASLIIDSVQSGLRLHEIKDFIKKGQDLNEDELKKQGQRLIRKMNKSKRLEN